MSVSICCLHLQEYILQKPQRTPLRAKQITLGELVAFHQTKLFFQHLYYCCTSGVSIIASQLFTNHVPPNEFLTIAT